MPRRTDPSAPAPRLCHRGQHGPVTSTFDPRLAVQLAALGPLRARVGRLLESVPPPSDARVGAWTGAAHESFESALGELRGQVLTAADAVAAAQALTERAVRDG